MEVSRNRPIFELLVEFIRIVRDIISLYQSFPEDSHPWLSEGVTYLLPKKMIKLTQKTTGP